MYERINEEMIRQIDLLLRSATPIERIATMYSIPTCVIRDIEHSFIRPDLTGRKHERAEWKPETPFELHLEIEHKRRLDEDKDDPLRKATQRR